jgi:hypothetical protein
MPGRSLVLLVSVTCAFTLTACGGETDRQRPDAVTTEGPLDTMLFHDPAQAQVPQDAPGTPTPP